ncbi:helix-turn-helix domain-containing protein [Brevibacillus laterosporus]|uniref:helix-turn-helix domain-containing protein n=1 Tax=Brevibacillus laterosporus TaxID=1465 RepID=UPI003D2616FE
MKIQFTLREILAERGISERQFALATKIREGTLYQICNNKIERLPIKMVETICNELNLEPGDWIKLRKDTE